MLQSSQSYMFAGVQVTHPSENHPNIPSTWDSYIFTILNAKVAII